MGLFDFLKSKKKKPADSTLAKLQEEIMHMSFPKGKEDIKRQVIELCEMFKGKYSVGEVGGTLCYMNSLFITSNDKSANRIVKIGAMHRPDNKFSEEDANVIYKYMVRQKVNEKFGDKAEIMFQTLYESLGNIEGGATTDEIPGGYGEYGLCITNPIPVNGVMSNELYLQSLKLLSGEKFNGKRCRKSVYSQILRQK